jgi:predicted RNA-binding Zn ribbon-like protein
MESLTREIADCVVDRFAASNLQDDIAGRVVARMQVQVTLDRHTAIMEGQIAVEQHERVKAWRVGVTVLGFLLGFLLGLFVGLYASRLPGGLTADLLACPSNYNRLDTKYALELASKQTQLASKQTQLASKQTQLAELEAKLGVLMMDNQHLMLELLKPSTSNLEKCIWGVNDMLWV